MCCSLEKGIVYVQDKGYKVEVITHSYRLSQHRGLLILSTTKHSWLLLAKDESQ